MPFAYFLSWFLNFLLISIILAWVDELKGYYLERTPWLTFGIAIFLPTMLEVFAFVVEGKPFLALLLPSLPFW